MDYRIHLSNGIELVEILTGDLLIQSPQDILDIMTQVHSSIFIIRKEMFHESFFDLKSGLAGDILQKLSNYNLKLAVVGDFSGYTGKSLRDFIYECNTSNRVVFVDDVVRAIEKLSK
jgi:hypothetical protein